MLIDDKLITYLEDLTFLTLSDDEKSQMAKDMDKIMNTLETICELNTEGVPECTHTFDKANIFRDDVIRPSFYRDLILQNAPFKNDEMFIAPKTLE